MSFFVSGLPCCISYDIIFNSFAAFITGKFDILSITKMSLGRFFLKYFFQYTYCSSLYNALITNCLVFLDLYFFDKKKYLSFDLQYKYR